MPMLEALEGRKRWHRRRHLLPIFAVASLGVLVAIAAWFVVSVWDTRLARSSFANVAGDYAVRLQTGLDQYLGKVSVLRAFYDSSHQVDRKEFEVFTSRILSGRHRMMRVSFSPRVQGAERTAFEERARDLGFVSYRISDWQKDGTFPAAPERETYFPVLFTTEAEGFPSLRSVDFASEPERRRVIERAGDGDRLATTSVALSHAGRGSWHGFFVALPVYQGGSRYGTLEERRRKLTGIIAGTFDLTAVLDSILSAAKLPEGIDLYLYDAASGAGDLPVYARRAGSAAPIAPLSQATLDKLPHWSQELRAGDARWTLVLTPSEGRLLSLYRAWIVLGFIVLVFGAVIAYMWASARYALQLESANTRILNLAQTDQLTSLPNRRAFLRQLTRAFLAARKRGGNPGFAVLYLDIDDFKDVNDTLGHPMGDALLKAIVERLKEAVAADDLVARFGGDEFAILQRKVSDPAEVGELATRVAGLMAAPFDVGGNIVRITSSIGISLYTPDLSGPEAMMVQADLALYRGKDDGRNCYRFYSRMLDQQVHERVTVTEELRAAIEEEQLELYYQPQVELDGGRIIGVEALLRWNHPTRGLLGPGYFIPIAERTGAVTMLGRFALERACRQLSAWQSERLDPRIVGVNVSGQQLKGGAELIRDVEAALMQAGVAPQDLELELTESVLMEATQKHSETLRYLRGLGLKIAIDDFGTGYSSLKYLTVYPMNRLKVAQELVFGVTNDFRNAAVVRAAIGLAHELGIDVIAEGVETEAQAEFLLDAGCEQAQGYYYSRPVTAAAMTELLRKGKISPQGRAARTRRQTAA